MEPGTGLRAGPRGERENGEPEVKKRRLLCVEFASVASCDAAVAQCYLAENAWEMEVRFRPSLLAAYPVERTVLACVFVFQRALNSYFEPPVEESATKSCPETPSEPEFCVDLTSEETTDSIVSKTSTSENIQQEDGSTFSLITWNIDGLDLNNLQERARGVCHEEGYFTAIMLKKSRVKFKSQEIIPFPNTKMRRNLLCVYASVSGNEFCLMTSHLESTRGHAEERMNQLKMVLKKMQEAPETATVVFAGDTNLRDQEVAKCGGLPSNILDVWEFLGKPKHCQYTWDTQMNSNLGISATCKLRFDRIFFRTAAEEGHIVPQSLDLLGLEKLDCGRFPSDHWGLLCNLDIIL
ncbi:hypothetical protein MC885_013808 [Smutsia gigantea]|nr:hypothetical protein MC885_013808 [Smutsia gigantea]